MRSVVIGTAGHIDHGKSALVRALTGVDPDRLKEEQERGITIDLGFANLVSGGVNLAFVDVPGHERFVRNMLAGAGGIDLVLLVVAADESVMPQTREHFDICRLLGVSAGVIAITKSDVADAEMQELAEMEVRELTAGSFLEDAPIVRVSAKTGERLDALLNTLVTASAAAPHRDVSRPCRLPIDRAFTVRGFGTVVTGTLVSGRLRVDDDVTVLPAATSARVRGLHVHGAARDAAEAGERVAVNLGGAAVADLSRGFTLCGSGAAEVTRRFDGVVHLLESAGRLRHGARVRVHQGTTEVMGRVGIAGAIDNGAAVAEIAPGESAFVRIRLESPAVLTRGDRFILRGYSPVTTVGGGVVLDPAPPRGALRTAAGRTRFEQLNAPPAAAAAVVRTLVAERGASGLSRSSLVSRLGLSAPMSASVVKDLADDGAVTPIGDSLVATATLDGLSTALVDAVRARHASRPLDEGLAREEARERLFAHAAPGVFDYVIERLTATGVLEATSVLALSGHRVSLSSEESAAMAAVEEVFRQSGFAPPDAADAARRAGVPADVAQRVTQLLVRRKQLVRLEGLHYHAERLDDLKREMRGLRESGTTGVDVGTFKERYGLSRKYAIPLLEYLDRERVTRRAGAGRVLV